MLCLVLQWHGSVMFCEVGYGNGKVGSRGVLLGKGDVR